MGSLKNIEAIQKMVQGTHFTQTKTVTGYKGTDRTEHREVGEIWEEYNPDGTVRCIWEQKSGYRVKRSPNSEILDKVREELNSYPNCRPECKSPKNTRLDSVFRKISGMCADCHFRMETKLKLSGEYEQYEKKKILENAKSFFKAADVEIEHIKDKVSSDFGVAHDNGQIELWDGSTTTADQIYNEYHEYKKIVLDRLEGKDEQ